ncbi:thioesterase-like superfamily-domain-containing protein [Mycena metata]|uniref:Thioesterase-like superfamily-domain-containing protein n=1 Tax=Mycena metata TaxID=1033252 RepID=A0AAD7JIV2_9AGAR|nr:thioesterase-like superfamily-domain-containing protein [Mycena metata]
MAPLTRAIRVARKADSTDASPLFSGHVDADWVFGQVPNGGYTLSLLVQACVQNQANSEYPDPLQVSAFFLQPTKTSSTVEVQLRVLKCGRSFINLAADLVFANRVCITAHLIFGKLPRPSRPLVDPSSGYSRRHPLLEHPSAAVVTSMPGVFSFSKHVRWAEDQNIIALNHADHPTRNALTGGGVAVWGAWIELGDKDDRITPASLVFFADCVNNLATLFPHSVTGAIQETLWLPTLSLALEYKTPIPPPSSMHASRTIGVYIVSGFPSEPQMRFNTFVEMWTAPSNIGEGAPVEGWRDGQVCLAIATQTQLIGNGSMNAKAAAKL